MAQNRWTEGWWLVRYQSKEDTTLRIIRVYRRGDVFWHDEMGETDADPLMLLYYTPVKLLDLDALSEEVETK